MFQRILFLFTIGITVYGSAEQTNEFVFSLPSGETISFYTRVAPDLSAIGFTKTKSGVFKYAPVVLDLQDQSITSLEDIAYDPTFSPDYNLELKRGFLFGARGTGSSYGKYFSFYLPGSFEREQREFFFSNISGYASVALLTDESILPEVLKPFVGNYLIMGKRWRWFIVKPVYNDIGEVIDYEQVHPSRGTTAASPLCPQLGPNFDKADSMISPQGQFISLKKTDRDKVPVIVRTMDCSVVSTPALEGIYGGKATFSNDEKYMAFHAFGADGRQRVGDQILNDDQIKTWADQGVVANVFLYEIQSDRLHQLTENDAQNSAVNLFPNFSGDSVWLYYHQHKPNAPSTEIFRSTNPAIKWK